MDSADNTVFDPSNVDLNSANARDVICFLGLGENEYNGDLNTRIGALFVILIVSTVFTYLPVAATRMPKLKIPIYVYLFARYFGAGVIIATAFIHLLDPAYAEIGPQTCVGMTGGWSSFSWVALLVLASVLFVFLLDFGAERYVEVKYGQAPCHRNVADIITNSEYSQKVLQSNNQLQGTVQSDSDRYTSKDAANATVLNDAWSLEAGKEAMSRAEELSFQQQIAAFLILEFGIIFHSVIIGLNLGTAGDEFSTLYPVLVFHQSFEGLGIGARLSAIPMPKRFNWLPWVLCAMYGLTTPIAIGIGLGLRTTYNGSSFIANVVSGVFDSISAGILIYTGLVELLARDFLFNPQRSRDSKRLAFMLGCVFLGAGIMTLLAKWA